MEQMQEMTFVGFTMTNALLISDLLHSNKLDPGIFIYDNQGRFHGPTDFMTHRYEFIADLNGRRNLAFCLARPMGKRDMFESLSLDPGDFVNLVHSSAVVSRYAHLGRGLMLDSRSHISHSAVLGDFVNLRGGCHVAHNCTVGRFSTLNQGAQLAGNARVGDTTVIGMGALVLGGVSVGSHCVIGAGSVVTRDIPDNTVAYGNPCRVVRENP